MRTLSDRARRELRGVHPALVAVVRKAWSLLDDDYEIIDGIRTLEEQRAYVRRGVSKTLRSYHLPQADGFGHAVDIVPLVNGVPKWPNNYEPWMPIEKAMKQAAGSLRVPIEWGGDWKHRWDKPHWQIPRTLVWNGPGNDVEPPDPTPQEPAYGDTKLFVKMFQDKFDLDVDGYPGPKTYKKLGEL